MKIKFTEEHFDKYNDKKFEVGEIVHAEVKDSFPTKFAVSSSNSSGRPRVIFVPKNKAVVVSNIDEMAGSSVLGVKKSTEYKRVREFILEVKEIVEERDLVLEEFIKTEECLNLYFGEK